MERRKPRVAKNTSETSLLLPAADNLKARDELRVAGAGNHFDNLFDQDEDRAGEKMDLATGRRIHNTPEEMPGTELSAVKRKKTDTSEDVLGSLEQENDAAAAWLRTHGGGEEMRP